MHLLNALFIFLLGSFLYTQNVYCFHIILDPAGDAKHTGRQLATCYERSVTLQFCEALKTFLIKQNPSCTVTITRTTGEACTQEQRAQIANQLHADLFIHISCFDESTIKPHMMIYFNAPTSETPFFTAPCTLIPAHRAHDLATQRTQKLVNALFKNISQPYYRVLAPCAIPDARLASIMIPACTIEFGISPTVPWTSLIEPIGSAILTALEKAP